MIRYALKCAQGHGFESWFQSASAFDSLVAAGHVECPVCGETSVEKALMAPKVSTADRTPEVEPTAGALSETDNLPVANMPENVRQAVEKLRAEVEKNSDYVGRGFAAEARAMHDGEKPERAIHGEANPEEARALIQDGVPILPLPFRDRRGTN